ncbi:3-deoxy-D-manno-octulosonate 8-phosphate phosphatase [Pelistega indica]|uniref:3-deoxy-D-manno-octulosonate 8-phosphate phosphatase KdsC n=1 Tax=Pelistega indica TaxID=1414851 RepID=V8G1R7_9BURK|nr:MULTISPECIES: HAD hydrolase family protein [Pelistega]ETD69903.1 3-deoxy-D-manno-octulosonate 8-phosphate phosphatase [Pelistega indica]
MNKILHPAESLILSKVPESVRQRAEKIRLIAFDVDGVLTDGSLLYSENGEQLKRFNALDGHGLKMLLQGGIMVALITGRSGPIVTRRAADLGINLLYQDARDKGKLITDIANEHHLNLEQIAYIGDDIIDLQAMQKVGLAVSVPHAPAYLQQAAHYVTTVQGGYGAARELADIVLASQGLLGPFLQGNLLVRGIAIQ